MTTMSDDELEARVRATLRAVASATPVEGGEGGGLPVYDDGPPRRRRGWLIPAGAAAAVALLLGALVTVAAVDDGGLTVGSPARTLPPPTSSTLAPRPEAAPGARSDGPVFTGDGDAHAVADAYLRARGVNSPTLLQQVDGRAAASWNINDSSGVVAEGTVYLALVGERWAVVEAITDGVTIDDLQVEEGRLTATVSTTNQNGFVFEVVDTDGNPFRGGERIGPVHPSLDVDVTVGDQPVILRAQLIGGAMLSVTEILVNPAAPEGGEPLAEGLWEGGDWRILGNTDCAWIELNGVAQGPTCGIDAASADPFLQLGPVARFGEETLLFGIVGPDVATVRAAIDDGQTISTDTVAETGRGARSVALSLPSTGVATVELVDGDGRVVGRTDVDLGGPIGG